MHVHMYLYSVYIYICMYMYIRVYVSFGTYMAMSTHLYAHVRLLEFNFPKSLYTSVEEASLLISRHF